MTLGASTASQRTLLRSTALGSIFLVATSGQIAGGLVVHSRSSALGTTLGVSTVGRLILQRATVLSLVTGIATRGEGGTVAQTLGLLRLTQYAAADAVLAEAIASAVLTEDVAATLDLIDTSADVELLNPSSTDLVLTP